MMPFHDAWPWAIGSAVVAGVSLLLWSQAGQRGFLVAMAAAQMSACAAAEASHSLSGVEGRMIASHAACIPIAAGLPGGVPSGLARCRRNAAAHCFDIPAAVIATASGPALNQLQ